MLRVLIRISIILLCILKIQGQVTSATAPGIVTVRPAGSGGRVAWSAQNVIAYDRTSEDGYFNVHLMNPDGSGDRCLTCNQSALPSRHKGNPDFSPSGNWIVFQAEKADAPLGVATDKLAAPGSGLYNDIWIMDRQGSNFWKLTDTPAPDGGVLHGHFSHKEDKLVWAERVGSSGRPFGEWAIKLADFAVVNGAPTVQNIRTFQPGARHWFYETHGFSSDDQLIYFSGNPDLDQGIYGFDIYSFRPATGELTNLTNTPTDWDEHAALSHDGSKIIWASSTNAGATLLALKTDYWVMNADGTNKRRLTWFNTPGNPESVSSPVATARVQWSPDDTQYIGFVITDNVGNTGLDAIFDLVNPTANVSGASFHAIPLAPDAIVSVFGRNLSDGVAVAKNLPLPIVLGDTSVQFTGSHGTQPAPLFFVSGGQVNYAVPSDLTPGIATLTVTQNNNVVAQGSVTIANVAPGIFSANASGAGVAAAEFQRKGGSVELVFQCGSGALSCASVPIDLSGGDVYLILYGTGIRHNRAGVTVRIGGQIAQVDYAGPQGGYAGLDQINVKVPASLAGRGEVDVEVLADGIAANTVRVNFK